MLFPGARDTEKKLDRREQRLERGTYSLRFSFCRNGWPALPAAKIADTFCIDFIGSMTLNAKCTVNHPQRYEKLDLY